MRPRQLASLDVQTSCKHSNTINMHEIIHSLCLCRASRTDSNTETRCNNAQIGQPRCRVFDSSARRQQTSGCAVHPMSFCWSCTTHWGAMIMKNAWTIMQRPVVSAIDHKTHAPTAFRHRRRQAFAGYYSVYRNMYLHWPCQRMDNMFSKQYTSSSSSSWRSADAFQRQ